MAHRRQLWHRHHAFGCPKRQSCGALWRDRVTVNTTRGGDCGTHEADCILFALRSAVESGAEMGADNFEGANTPLLEAPSVERSGDCSWSVSWRSPVHSDDMLMAGPL